MSINIVSTLIHQSLQLIGDKDTVFQPIVTENISQTFKPIISNSFQVTINIYLILARIEAPVADNCLRE